MCAQVLYSELRGGLEGCLAKIEGGRAPAGVTLPPRTPPQIHPPPRQPGGPHPPSSGPPAGGTYHACVRGLLAVLAFTYRGWRGDKTRGARYIWLCTPLLHSACGLSPGKPMSPHVHMPHQKLSAPHHIICNYRSSNVRRAVCVTSTVYRQEINAHTMSHGTRPA